MRQKKVWYGREVSNCGVLYRMGRLVGSGWQLEIRVMVSWPEIHRGRGAVAYRLLRARRELRSKTVSF